MFHLKCLKGWSVVAALAMAVVSASAQLTINGVADKTRHTDTATFTIVTQPGFTYSAFLNTNPVPAGVPVTVNRPDFYELSVQRIDNTTSAVTNRLLRFLVHDSARANTEWGLPPQTPWPVIQSSLSEFAGAHLRLIAPESFPPGYDIPVVVWAENDQGHAVRANGMLTAAGLPFFQIRRGVGSGFLTNTKTFGQINYALGLQGLQTNLIVNLDPTNTPWTTVSGSLGTTTWPTGSRIHVTSQITLLAGATLTVGAGTIVRVNGGVNIISTNNCRILINGTAEQPVVFMPTIRTQPWGGFIQHANDAEFSATSAIFTGSGFEPCWFDGEGCSGSVSGIGSHRGEQALVSLRGANCNLSMTDSAAIFMAGQLGHSVGSSAAFGYRITLTRFLMQRASTGGEYTRANFVVNDSAFIECPDDSVNFVNGDNDGLYIIGGTHGFTNSLFGWTKDDGVDSGGTDSATTGFGKLDYQSCWFEATFHEGNSLSGYKNIHARDTVYLDCGQGIEDGYNAPTGRVDHCLFAACQVGVRHGDNYENNGNYDGRMTATNCLLLFNHRDIFGYNWRSGTGNGWTQALGQMSCNANLLTVANTNFPNNAVWNPASDAGKLAAFGARAHVGAAIAVRAGQTSLTNFPDGLPVGLSMFCTNAVSVNYSVTGTDGTGASGTLLFPPGLLRNFIPLPASFSGVLRVALSNPVKADLTGTSALLLQNLPGPTTATLIPFGSSWKFLDDGSNQGTAWRAPGFDDAGWSTGFAELGFGDSPADETTLMRRTNIVSGTTNLTFYFRKAITVDDPSLFATLAFTLKYDDGGVIYLNGSELYRVNLPAGAITYQTTAPATAENSLGTTNLSASLLLPGANVIAVEIHQQSLGSSDVSFDLSLVAAPAPPPVRVNILPLGGAPVIYWSDGTFTLEQSPSAVNGTWTPAASASPIPVNPANPQSFFRLRKP